MEAKLDQLLVLVQKQQQQLIQQEERYSQLKKEIESLKGNATPEVIDATNSNESVVAPTENTWENAKKAVVKILVWIQEPDFQDPWQSKGIQQYGGSGAVIKVGEKLLIITNAHVIANHTLVQVQKCDDPTRKEAKVIFCSHESDLALVEVDDNFLDDMVPIDLAIGLPKLRDMIYVLGFPVGGDEISITEGVVSRIESQQYSHSLNYLLAVTIAINAGNSGGPVLKDNKLVGVAFQAISPDHAESIGHVVPIPVVNHFLECFLRKIDFRIPHLMISTQFFTNPLMRKEYGMDESQSGIVVTRVGYNNSCWEVLEPDDILLEVCGYKISNLGTIEWQNHRMAWYVVPQNLFVGDSCELVIMRKKKSMKVAIPKLLPEFSFLPYLIDKPPTYYIYCGFLFMQLTVDYLMVWGQNWLNDAPKELLNLRYEFPTPERTGIVIVSKVLAASINHGYEAAGDLVIVSVNGKKVKDIFDFVEKVETAETDTIDIRTTENYIFVLPSLKDNSTRELNNKLLEQYKIPSDRSLNLQKSSK